MRFPLCDLDQFQLHAAWKPSEKIRAKDFHLGHFSGSVVLMNPTCTNSFRTTEGTFRCQKDAGHDYGHLTYINGVKTGWNQAPYRAWFENEYRQGVLGIFDETTEPTTTVQLTLTDLKTIAYYMAEEEDADKTKTKIDKAMKEML